MQFNNIGGYEIFKNVCERYGDNVEVTIEDYQKLNPEGKFEELKYTIIETISEEEICGLEQVEVVAVKYSVI